jgi:hypothetical protein
VIAAGGIAARIEAAWERAVSRPATSRERDTLLELYRKELARFRKSPADARALIAAGEAPHKAVVRDEADLAATISVTRAILNLHELITRN